VYLPQETVAVDESAQDANLAREREPTIVMVGVLLLGALVSVCLALIVTVIWAAMTEDVKPRATYQQCGTVKDEAGQHRPEAFIAIVEGSQSEPLIQRQDAPRAT
jgi:hypothetical protein